MKLDVNNPNQLNDSAIHVKKEVLHLGRQQRQKGHSVFSYNPDTLEIKCILKADEKVRPQVHLSDVVVPEGKRLITPAGEDTLVNTLPTKETDVYVQALNQANAIKKFKKLGFTEFKSI
jgi:hypothetical protein